MEETPCKVCWPRLRDDLGVTRNVHQKQPRTRCLRSINGS